MATVTTVQSVQDLEDYLNEITLPSTWDIVSKRGIFSFLSVSDVVAGGPNGFSVEIAKSESELEAMITTLSGSADLTNILNFGAYWVVVYKTGTSVYNPIVTTYKSAYDLSVALGVEVISGLDDSTANSSAVVQLPVSLDNLIQGDQLISYGGLYTLIKDVPAGTVVRAKGGYYTVIIL